MKIRLMACNSRNNIHTVNKEIVYADLEKIVYTNN